MDELSAALAGSFEITSDPNKISAPHPRFSQFKAKSSKQDQNSRRQRLLEIQKKNRFDYTNHVRKLTEDDWKDEDEEEDEEEENEDMDVEIKMKRPGRYYKDQLMLSEWLVEVPSDFSKEWLMVLCPVGRRSLVVTNGHTTKTYSKSGHFVRSFPSHLPGGNRKQARHRYSTILDCVYNELEKTYYVLDLMCWNGHSVYDTETEFRFFWLHDKLQEAGGQLAEITKINPFKFVALPSFPCTPESITSAVSAANFEIDGMLFYHKRAHYLFGSSPLVAWLKPYMLPEILGIPVPEQQMAHRPATYTTYANHMQEVGDNRAKDTVTTRRDYKAYGHAAWKGRHSGGGDVDDMDDEGIADDGVAEGRAAMGDDTEGQQGCGAKTQGGGKRRKRRSRRKEAERMDDEIPDPGAGGEPGEQSVVTGVNGAPPLPGGDQVSRGVLRGGDENGAMEADSSVNPRT